MGDLTANFDRSEFNVSGDVPPEYEGNVIALATMLQAFRDQFTAALGRPTPMILTSCYRTLEHNHDVYAGTPNAASLPAYNGSQHLTASAADCIVVGVTDHEAAAAVLSGGAPAFGQLIVYDDKPHIHFSLPRSNGEPNAQILRGLLDASKNRLYQLVQSASDVPILSKWGTVASALLVVLGGVLAWGLLPQIAQRIIA